MRVKGDIGNSNNVLRRTNLTVMINAADTDVHTYIVKWSFFGLMVCGGVAEPELKIIDVFVCKLRKKLSMACGGENYIETVWGRGYVLRDPVAHEAAGEHMAKASAA
jgi:hypothetical protein